MNDNLQPRSDLGLAKGEEEERERKRKRKAELGLCLAQLCSAQLNLLLPLISKAG